MKKLIFLLPILFLISCGVQKRKYQKGYYVNWNKSEVRHTTPNTTTKKTALPTAEREPIKSEAAQIENATEQVYASVDVSKTDAGATRKKLTIRDNLCDELIFNDGTEQRGKVIEITETEIKYKKCDLEDGPTYTVKKSSLFMIKYADGRREVFKESKQAANSSPVKQNNSKGVKKTHPMAVASLVMGILSVVPYFTIITGILAIVFGNMALKKIAANPDRYDGEGIAKAGKIIGIVFLSLYTLIILLAIMIALLLVI